MKVGEADTTWHNVDMLAYGIEPANRANSTTVWVLLKGGTSQNDPKQPKTTQNKPLLGCSGLFGYLGCFGLFHQNNPEQPKSGLFWVVLGRSGLFPLLVVPTYRAIWNTTLLPPRVMPHPEVL